MEEEKKGCELVAGAGGGGGVGGGGKEGREREGKVMGTGLNNLIE